MLTDVAHIVDGVENNKQAAWMNTTPAVILNIQRQPGANTISVVKSIKKLLPQLEANLPAAIQVTTLTDLTTAIHASISDVEFELMLTVALVVMVIFLFLRSLYATIIPSVAVPLRWSAPSARCTSRLQPRQPLADGADHLHRLRGRRRHRDDREHLPLHRGRRSSDGGRAKGAEQIGFTIVSLTVSLIAVLIPLLFMGDVVGRLFREFAVTLAVTIVISAVVSLTLTPMMSARILRHNPEASRAASTRLGTRLRAA